MDQNCWNGSISQCLFCFATYYQWVNQVKKIDVGQVLVYLTHFLFAVCLATVSFFFESERFLDYELFFHCERHDIIPFQYLFKTYSLNFSVKYFWHEWLSCWVVPWLIWLPVSYWLLVLVTNSLSNCMSDQLNNSHKLLVGTTKLTETCSQTCWLLL